MGLAASQARLLSITSRMSDNELRSQLISNAKMRLTSDSARVSDEYVAALNQTQLMFQNFDPEGNEMYQALTFNSLTAYSAYNNQYGIANSAGEIIVSAEDDAKFQNAGGDLKKFLESYGLEQTTNYFEEITKSPDFIEREGIGYYDDQGAWQVIAKGMTAEELQAIYEGTPYGGIEHYGQTNSINSTEYGDYEKLAAQYADKRSAYKNELHKTIKNILNGTLPIDGKANSPVFKVDGKTIDETYQDFNNHIEDVDKYYNKLVDFANLIGFNAPKNLPMKDWSYSKPNSVGILYSDQKIDDFLATINNHKDILTYDLSSDGKEVIRHIYESDGYYAMFKVTNGTVADDPVQLNGISGYLTPPGSDSTYYAGYGEASFSTTQISGVPVLKLNTEDPWTPSSDNEEYIPAYKYTDSNGQVHFIHQRHPDWANINATYSLEPCTRAMIYDTRTQKSEDTDIQEELLNLYDDFIANLEDFIDPEYFTTRHMNKFPELNNKYDAYVEAATNLANFIWGENGATAKGILQNDQTTSEDLLGYLDDPSWVLSTNHVNTDANAKISVTHYNPIDFPTTTVEENKDPETFDAETTTYDANGNPQVSSNQFTRNYQTVKDLFILDCMMEHYGMPTYTWIDKQNPNEDGQAKATWYSNLFARMQKGYEVIGDGLSNSREWLQFAFESGLVHMEQVNKSSEWVSTMYSNCSSITESTVDVDVTIAEAKYKREMAKIEAKDKQYDMELKNIDTEHESLKQEYDSIKQVIGKNIERNFKLFQNA